MMQCSSYIKMIRAGMAGLGYNIFVAIEGLW